MVATFQGLQPTVKKLMNQNFLNHLYDKSMLILPCICVPFMLDFEQTQNKGLMYLCQTTRPITKCRTISICLNIISFLLEFDYLHKF